MSDSDSVHDLLVRGIAAAKSNLPQDKEEARYFLQWVLRSDPAPDQQAEAWLWLSQVEEAPAKKRDCLENVLAIDPGNPLARRGLLILDGPLKPADVINPIGPDQPIEIGAQPKARRYVCPRCGGSMAFDPNRKQLTCAYCGNHLYEYTAIQQGALAAPIEEQNFIAALPTEKAHHWELAAAHSLSCQSCGAHFTLPPKAISGACPFCGSPQVIDATANAQLIQPQGVLPFQFDEAEALKRMRDWLSAQRFHPKDLDQRSAFSQPRGVYLPFWTFDLGGQMHWHAEIAQQRGRDMEWVPRDDLEIVLHDDLLVPGTHSVSIERLEQLTDFNTKSLEPYSSDLLAEWSAEIYQISMADASLVARQRALELAKAHVTHVKLAGEQMRNLQFNTAEIVIESFKLVLLPIWIGGYRYRDQLQALVVNGQTGKVSGQVPRSGLEKALSGIFGQE